MLGWLVRRRLNAFARDFNYDASYMQEMYELAPRSFWRYSRVASLAHDRGPVPKAAWYAANLTAAITEDCGPCAQLGVTMAERAGVSASDLRAVVAGDTRAMSDDAAVGYRFAKAVLERDLAESDRLRAEVESRWGKRAVVLLGLGIAATRTFPTVKYAMGHGRECSRLRVAGTEVPVAKQAVHA
jgi:hypothetical protein